MGGSPTTPAATQVAVLESRRLLRQALSIWLTAETDVDLVGSTSSTNTIIQLCETQHVDVVLVGIDSEQERMFRDAQLLSRRFPSVRLIAIGDTPDAEADSILSNGFKTVVSASAGIPNLLRVVRATPVLRAVKRPVHTSRPVGPLTPRELEVLSHVGQGRTSQDISSRLGISRSTVANHKERIFAKLEAKNQAHAVALAVSLGILSPAQLPKKHDDA